MCKCLGISDKNIYPIQKQMRGGGLNFLAQLLVLVGALNWGLVGALDIDAVKHIVPHSYVKTVYVLVGVAALYLILCRLM